MRSGGGAPGVGAKRRRGGGDVADEVPFVQLCRDCLIRQFGIKTLAVKQLRQLFACIATEESRARHARLGSFARLVGVAEPEGSRVQCALFVKLAAAYAMCADEQQRKYAKIFAELDADGSGAIDAKELQAGLRRLGRQVTLKDARAMIAAHDEDKSGATTGTSSPR